MQHFKPANKSYKQGYYKINNIDKYKGNPATCCYRSSWEEKFMKWADSNSSIVEWSSEEIVINYINPFDGKNHRYYVDFYIKVSKKDGCTKEYIVELKPSKFLKKPKKRKKC